MDKKLLYVGCGHHRMSGFIHAEINIGKSKSGPPDILADVTDHVPIKNNSVDLIYSRATLEHFTYTELINHLLECWRILKPGGCVRAVVPDFDLMIKDYQNKIHFNDLGKSNDHPNEDYVDMFVFRALYHDHFYLHNFQTLSKIFHKTGFGNVRKCDPGDSKIKEANDELLLSELARFGEIIIEATKTDEKPSVKKIEKAYPNNFVKRFLAKYFNIGIVPFVKRKAIFPQKSWFKEKWMEFTAPEFLDLDKIIPHKTGSHGKSVKKPRYKNKLDY